MQPNQRARRTKISLSRLRRVIRSNVAKADVLIRVRHGMQVSSVPASPNTGSKDELLQGVSTFALLIATFW